MKLTPWFVNGEKPVRPGVYSVSCRRQHQTGEWYSHWDGQCFGPFSLEPQRAEVAHARYKKAGDHVHAGNAVLPRGSWRGLAEEPKQ